MDRYIGRKLDGRYEVQEILGVGGMSVVYKAYDSIDDRTVAVKILKEEYLSNEEFRRRFKNESKAVAVLSHPNIVKVYDVSFSEKLQYIVMEYIDGITLKEYIDQQKVLTWKEAVYFTVQILRALQHAHERGIVHRDIKPQNIMLLSDGSIKVTDFGIARFAHSETRTMTDKAIGSVHYISPEQARGEETDDKTDIYSVGVMLYEMLTGRLPFEADSAVSVAIMQMQTDPKKPREINETIPEGLEDITLRAMQKDTSQRYQSAVEMLKDIEKFKQNPSIRFEYKYFVDDNPTKYVESINKIKGIEDPVKGKKKKKKASYLPILSGIAAAIVLVALGLLIAFLFVNNYFPGSASSQMTAPNLVGKKYTDVRADPQYKNLDIEQGTTAYDDSVPEGCIISQNPAPPMTVKVHGTITVTVSKGPQTAQVPDVTGKEQSEAESILNQAGFKNLTIQQVNDSQTTAGYVMYTDPAKLTDNVPVKTAITIVVSKGPQEVTDKVPDVTNSNISDAKAAITNKKFIVGTVKYVASSKPRDTVVSQDPQGGTTGTQGATTVNLQVSQGPDVSFTVNLPKSSAQYVINVEIDNSVITVSNGSVNLPDPTYGGEVVITIPGGAYIGDKQPKQVDIYVQGGDKQIQNSVYQSYSVNFNTGEIVKTLADNHTNFQ